MKQDWMSPRDKATGAIHPSPMILLSVSLLFKFFFFFFFPPSCPISLSLDQSVLGWLDWFGRLIACRRKLTHSAQQTREIRAHKVAIRFIRKGIDNRRTRRVNQDLFFFFLLSLQTFIPLLSFFLPYVALRYGSINKQSARYYSETTKVLATTIHNILNKNIEMKSHLSQVKGLQNKKNILLYVIEFHSQTGIQINQSFLFGGSCDPLNNPK